MSDFPAIDANVVGTWPQDAVNRYNRLDYYFAKATSTYRKKRAGFARLIPATIPWTPNMGPVQRRVSLEGSPILRQEVNPNRINSDPLTDMPDTGERSHDLVLYWHDFMTKNFTFLPAFEDFMGSHLQPNIEFMQRDMLLFEEFFYRTHIWHYSPYVYVCGLGLVDAPVPSSYNAVTSGKNMEWLAEQVVQMTSKGDNAYLNLRNIHELVSGIAEEVGMEPYSGQIAENGDKLPLNEQYAILTSPRVWRGLLDDPWLKENRPLNMNIVTEGFRGDFFGLAKILFQGFPQRWKVTDTSGSIALTAPAPETRQTEPTHPDFMRPKPHADYVKNCKVEVSYMIGGGRHYQRVTTSPPPAVIAAARDGQAMNWNGKVNLTKDFLIPAKNAAGETVWQTNNKGRYVRGEATKIMGIARDNPHQIIPIIHFIKPPSITTLSAS